VHLSLTDILERLNDRFRLLVGGRRRIQRQQTLTAALDWSYDLLDPDEQLLLRRLAVFRGSFSLSGAEAICHPKALELLRSLVTKSLVDISDNDVEVRYRLLESVRVYAEQKLVESGESEQLRSAHRDFYLEWIESLPLGRLMRLPDSSLLVAKADNLTAALAWCRAQRRYDLCGRIAARMAGYWYSSIRLREMMRWWRELDAGLSAEDRDHRAMALLLRSWAAALAGEWEELNVWSVHASALADPHGWVSAAALYLQAGYWAIVDPPRSDRLYNRIVELASGIDLAPDPLGYAALYGARLKVANGSDEALALLHRWLADLGDSTPTPILAGALALYGQTRIALEIKSRIAPARMPMGQFMVKLSEAVVASAQGQFDEAVRHLAATASVVRDFALPRGEAACLIGFAKVALDRGDYARASQLLAAFKTSVNPKDTPVVTPLDDLVYVHCTRVLQEALDPKIARSTQAEGAALSVKEALDAELSSRTTATSDLAD
jgi:hypothetical protein